MADGTLFVLIVEPVPTEGVLSSTRQMQSADGSGARQILTTRVEVNMKTLNRPHVIATLLMADQGQDRTT